MKNAYEVLRQKELELSKVKAEVEALRAIAPLLTDDNEVTDDPKTAAAGSIAPLRSIRVPRAANDSLRTADAPVWDGRARWP